MADYYPYADKYPVNRRMPEQGRAREEVLSELQEIAGQEDGFWQTGQCSGTMYCGDMDHYAFMSQVSGLYAHVNILQRDICPSATRFEGEIIAMTLDMLHGDPTTGACGSTTSGGSESILSAVLAYREWGQSQKGIHKPEMILPETAHVAFRKAAHLFGLEVHLAPVDPVTTQVDLNFVRDHINANTVLLVGSACNYGYGTIDAIDELSALAVDHDIGLHVDACLGGFILPWGEALGYDIAVFDFRLPGVTTISADTHKYGYGPKGSSVLAFRSKELRQGLYFMQQEWSGGKYFSPGIAGSRPGGVLAATWASMVSLGKEGYLRYAREIFTTAFAMQDLVRSHPELKIVGKPSFCFSFFSEVFDIYLLNDFMRDRGWRFNGQQHPNALHMCVTRPQTKAGITEKLGTDLAEAVAYAVEHKEEEARTGAVYGGMPKGVPAITNAIQEVMTGMLDAQQDVPPE
jgi:glutamate/tyrosine decarboxylase-like PLP-dependent enzyme